ncbi:hypothetical protein AG0111_0g9311 [Alternaria gaisen]|uniref:Uncharacterized protein n=1 Tax=Alternaria gaisen TaxID=167740 RepID=A0ACB6FEM2_9PLEO|nr:hypothetical protein AG0111_0g9311 [Alternaria gaisen]
MRKADVKLSIRFRRKRSITCRQKYVPSNIFTFAPPAQSAEEKGVSERMIILTSIFPSKSPLRWKTQSE